MSHRVSAGELELRWKLKHWLYDFFDSMKYRMMENLHEKGTSWKKITKKYLLRKLRASIKAGNWVDVANYAFMLNDKQGA